MEPAEPVVVPISVRDALIGTLRHSQNPMSFSNMSNSQNSEPAASAAAAAKAEIFDDNLDTRSEKSTGRSLLGYVASLDFDRFSQHLDETGYDSGDEHDFPAVPLSTLGRPETWEPFYGELCARGRSAANEQPGNNEVATFNTAAVTEVEQNVSRAQQVLPCIVCTDRNFDTEEERETHEVLAHFYCRPCDRFFSEVTSYGQVSLVGRPEMLLPLSNKFFLSTAPQLLIMTITLSVISVA
jgi:hypothetical protein